jgi:hypothetical protein
MAHQELTRKKRPIIALLLSLSLIILRPLDASGQAMGTISENPENPLGLPTAPIAISGKPVGSAAGAAAINPNASESIAIPVATPSPTPGPGIAPFSPSEVPVWTFILSESYQFLSDRSRTGGLSLDSDSTLTDLLAALNRWPWTWLGIAYIYSHVSGSSPAGANQTGNQNVGLFTLLQPYYPFGQKQPALLTNDRVNHQFAIILTSAYGDSLTSTTMSHFPSIRSSARTFFGYALLDYQCAWFPGRKGYETYPGWLFEISSGIQFDSIRLHSSDSTSSATSSGYQLTYRNIGSATYSFSNRFGLFASAEWDAPIDSSPLRGSQPFDASTAVFTGGIVYNIYAYKTPEHAPSRAWKEKLSQWSASLLYSYTAFDPLGENNQLQVQISYTF